MRAYYLALAASICALLPVAASAQEADSAEDVVVESLTVSSPMPGPAWWRVSKGDSVVWLLPTPQYLPADLPWDQSILQRRLSGARELILPPTISIKTSEVAELLRSRAAVSAPPPELAARRDRAALGARLTPGRYQTSPTPIAAMALSRNAAESWRLAPSRVRDQVTAAAQRAGVEARPQVSYGIQAVSPTAPAPGPQAAADCLTGMIDWVEAGPAPVRAQALAWASGDVRGAVGPPRPTAACNVAIPGLAELYARTREEHFAVVEAALSEPGHAVALVPIRDLLAHGGLLARLKAKGYDVRAPGEAPGPRGPEA